MRDSDEQYTPKFIFESLNVEFDLDVCAPEGGVEWIPAKKHYSLKDNSLNQSWQGFIWMNPPYSEGKVWHEKFVFHNNGIALVPMAKSAWFYDLWNNLNLSVLMVSPKMKFIKPDGKLNSILMPVCLIGAGLRAKNILANCNLGKVR